MNKIKNSTAGFTLIELMIVVIIVAVLAAVGIPLLQGNVERAKLTEAVAGLGTIRTAVRAKVAELGQGSASSTSATDLRDKMGLKLGDLTGRFFEDNDYTYTLQQQITPGNPTATPPVPATELQCCISVTGDTAAGEAGASALRGSEVNTLVRSMDENGDIFNTVDCTGTAIN